MGGVGQRLMKNLHLDRPIAFIDFETTGLNPSTDRIVELTVLKVHLDAKRRVEEHQDQPTNADPIESSSSRL